MQKKLIALAIAAAFSTPVLAADASVYGIIDGGIASISSDGHKSDMRAVSGGLSASRIGVNASEDLDNGMKVSINVEYGMDTQKDTAAAGPFTTRQEMLALSGDFGKLSTGYLHTVAFFFNLKYDPTYGSLISPLQAINSGAGSFLGTAARMTQTIAYATPKMGPFSAEVNYSTGNADGANSGLASNNNTVSNKTTIMLLSGTYADGPLSVSAVYGKDSSDFTTFQSKTDTILGASYDLGVAKVMGTYVSSKTATTNTLFSFSGVMPMGSGSVIASYAANSRAAASTNGNGFMVGYLQSLSKATTAYVAFESVQNDSGTFTHTVMNNSLTTGLTAGGSSNLIIAGLRKKF